MKFHLITTSFKFYLLIVAFVLFLTPTAQAQPALTCTYVKNAITGLYVPTATFPNPYSGGSSFGDNNAI